MIMYQTCFSEVTAHLSEGLELRNKRVQTNIVIKGEGPGYRKHDVAGTMSTFPPGDSSTIQVAHTRNDELFALNKKLDATVSAFIELKNQLKRNNGRNRCCKGSWMSPR